MVVQPMVKTFTVPGGPTVTASGSQSTVTTVSALALPNNWWTYTETVTWSYDVTNGIDHLWGTYQYTFFAGSLAGSTFFNLNASLDDWYTTSSSTPYSGSSLSDRCMSFVDGGHTHRSLTQTKTSSTLFGTLAHAEFDQSTDTHSLGSGQYWHTIDGGTVNGTSTVSNSTADKLHKSANFVQLSTGLWTITGSATGSGSGADDSSYAGTGSYTIIGVEGTVHESGDNADSYQYSVSGTFHPERMASYSCYWTDPRVWDMTGNGSDRGHNFDDSTYSGSGPYTTSGSDVTGSWISSGDIDEAGDSHSRAKWTQGFTLGASGWVATSGTGSADSQSEAYYFYTGGGQYNTESVENAGSSWSVDGDSEECGGYQQSASQHTDSIFNGSNWISGGDGSGSGESLSFSSRSGSGSFSNPIRGGSITGDANVVGSDTPGGRWENGFNFDFNQYETSSEMSNNGPWVSEGDASGTSISSSHMSFAGSGEYTNYGGDPFASGPNSGSFSMSGSATQQGSQDLYHEAYPQWTLSSGRRVEPLVRERVRHPTRSLVDVRTRGPASLPVVRAVLRLTAPCSVPTTTTGSRILPPREANGVPTRPTSRAGRKAAWPAILGS